jgi:hypothetical protein
MEASAIGQNSKDLTVQAANKKSISFCDSKIYRFIVELFSCMCRLFHCKSQSPSPRQREITPPGVHGSEDVFNEIKTKINEIENCSVKMSEILPNPTNNIRAVKEFIRDQKREGAEGSRDFISKDNKMVYIELLKKTFEFTDQDITEVEPYLTDKAYKTTLKILNFFSQDKEKTIKALLHFSQGICQGAKPQAEFSKASKITQVIKENGLPIDQFSNIYLGHKINEDNLDVQLTAKKTYQSEEKSFSITLQASLMFDKEGKIYNYRSWLTKEGL